MELAISEPCSSTPCSGSEESSHTHQATLGNIQGGGGICGWAGHEHQVEVGIVGGVQEHLPQHGAWWAHSLLWSARVISNRGLYDSMVISLLQQHKYEEAEAITLKNEISDYLQQWPLFRGFEQTKWHPNQITTWTCTKVMKRGISCVQGGVAQQLASWRYTVASNLLSKWSSA